MSTNALMLNASRQGRCSSQIFGGAKKIAKKGSIFPFGQKIILRWGRRPYSRYAPASRLYFW